MPERQQCSFYGEPRAFFVANMSKHKRVEDIACAPLVQYTGTRFMNGGATLRGNGKDHPNMFGLTTHEKIENISKVRNKK